MKFTPIERNHIIQASEDLDVDEKSYWAEYWLTIPEKRKEYPFKELIKRAYQIATQTQIPPDFFQSNDGYRSYIERKFNCRSLDLTYQSISAFGKTSRFSPKKISIFFINMLGSHTIQLTLIT